MLKCLIYLLCICFLPYLCSVKMKVLLPSEIRKIFCLI
nr:MAG TPA: hypothetical protein [Caudoviricetes sp.]